jgi:alkylation response protein AidB-like acyl-CoA dehydrogenase
MTVDPVLTQIVREVLADPSATEQPETGLPPLWATVCELGWPQVGVDESAGGAGGELADLAEIVRLLSAHPVSVPLVEASVATWAAAGAGLDVGEPTLCVPVLPRSGESLTVDGGRVSGVATRVPWARLADRLLVAAGDRLALVDPTSDGVTITPGSNLAEEPRDTVSFRAAPVLAEAAGPGVDRLRARAALLRTAGIVGALERAGELTLEHVRTREQFGRPLVAFQAVGHGVAEIACEREQARAALAAVLAAPDDPQQLAVARVVTGRAAGEVRRLAHQLHGAIGITREHDLHRYAGRLLAWRDELGTQREWTRQLGAAVAARGSAGLWQWLTSEGEDHE